MDLNCPKETVEYVKSRANYMGQGLAIVPVSSPKMTRMPDNLKVLHGLSAIRTKLKRTRVNRFIVKEDWESAVHKLLEAGAENVVVTAGSKGVMAGKRGGEVKRYTGNRRCIS